MAVKFLGLFLTSIRVAKSIGYVRFSSDPEYSQTLTRELCGEQDAGWIDSPDAYGDRTGETTRRAA